LIRDRDRERYEKRVGTVVNGRWRIDSLLGLGSTSAVYAATHRNGHRAALKILHAALCSDATMTERFLGEAGIANAIKHRAIVPIGDDGVTEDGCAYLVLELLEGETLDEIRARNEGRIPIEEFASIADELMSAISAVHAAGIIHRDLKPGNVMITKDKRLKLLDFGTARIFDREGSKLTMQGLVLGTPSFMSPEQANGWRSEVDAQSDVWSLGAMIFTMLSGEFVHEGPDDHARLLAAATKPARSLLKGAPWLDDRVITVVDRALAQAKADRWPDVASMRIAFRNAVIASVPSLRDLKAFDDVSDGRDLPSVPMSASSDPTIVMDSPPEMEQLRAMPLATSANRASGAVDSAAPGSSPSASTSQAVRRKSTKIPAVALVLGFGAMAVVIALVVFFVMGGDVSTGRSASPAAPSPPSAEVEVAPAPPPVLVAPAASFIVISAPDLPETGAAPKPSAAPLKAPSMKSAPPQKAASTVASGSKNTTVEAADTAAAPPSPAPVPTETEVQSHTE
jgi:serine/threonine-protein kinase